MPTIAADVILENGVTGIPQRAFENCANLTSITMGNCVVSIGESSFYECIKLTSINYSGTIAEWDAISKGSSWDEYYHNGRYTKINYTITYNHIFE
jgi:hypothetical protein